jgi:phosphoribosyl 1,2-cyclic phosphodiesterase/AmiR/NasT family two-component response regulator
MSTPWQSKGRILIGEDLRTLSCRMQETLERHGYTVEVACDGEEVLRQVRIFEPALVVLDIMMPRMHGISVLKALRGDSATSKVGVLICTAKDTPGDTAICRDLGVTELLVKPFTPEVLIEKVEDFFSRRERAASALGVNAATAPSTPFRQTLAEALGRYTLWGTRGSTPVPGARFLRHGGNTSCLSIECGGETIILDAGTGIRELGLELKKEDSRKIHLFITHTHWDHIQGFPFFTPAYVPGFDIMIYGAEGFGKDLRSVFRGQLDRDYFPVQMEDMNAQIDFRNLGANPVAAGSALVHWEFAQHPGATVGYKVEVAGRKIAWVPDNEFLQGYCGAPEEITADHPRVAPYAKMIAFLSDADVVIHEAQYTPEEYPQKMRWGHSSIANAAVLMKLAGVKRWLITHHDPMHDDAFLEVKLNVTRRILDRIGHPIQVSHAYDGLTEYF